MPHNTLRTIGASVVLVGLSIAGIVQLAPIGDETPVEIVAEEPSGTGSTSDDSDTSSTQPTPFVYRIGVLSGVTTDNFWEFYGEQPSVWNSYVLGPTKPALFTLGGSSGGVQPELASDMVEPVFDADGWRVRVDLRSDLTWSDGVPVTAHDIVFTFDTVRSLELGGSWADSFPETIESIHADGDHRLRIEFTERPPLSVWPHGVGLAPIMAAHTWGPQAEGLTDKELYGVTGEVDVSGGPLTIDSISESVITAVANEGYPGSDGPDRVEYRVYSDEAGAVDGLIQGAIDTVVSPQGLSNESLDMLRSVPDVEVLESPGNAIRYLGFNLDRDPMTDGAFRTAVALLLDRASLAGSIQGAGPPAWSLVSESDSLWFDAGAAEENAMLYDGPLADRLGQALKGLRSAGYDWEREPSIDEGRHLVAGAGLTIDGRVPQPLTILTPGDSYDPARLAYVDAIAEALEALGFDARPVVTDFDTVVDLAFKPDENDELHYDMYVLGWTLGNPALPDYHEVLFAKDGAMNNTGYNSGKFAKALTAYQGALTTQAAFEALWDMERTLAHDLPYLPLYTDVIAEAYRSDRVRFEIGESPGGIQARLGGILDVRPAG